MKITDVTARAVREPVSKRTYVIVTIETDADVTGVGEASARADVQGTVWQILHAKQHLIGQDALAAEAVRSSLADAYKGSRVGLAAVVNMALLDILGKVSQAPLYEMLGGPTRSKARAIAQLTGNELVELRKSVERAHAVGFRAFLVPLPTPTGTTRGRSFFERTYQLFQTLRQTAGRDSDFVLDCRGQLSAADAVGLARRFEAFHLLWLDEPCDQTSVKKITAESVTPVGVGRDVTHNSRFQELLRDDSIDVLRPDIVRCGITNVRKAAALAETYYVAVAPQHRGGPIATAAALHVAASIPNFFALDVPFPADQRDQRMRRELGGSALETPTDGYLSLPTGPGLGISLNEDVFDKFGVG